MINKKIQGKKNRAAGQRFELKVRKDMESKGFIVSKWMNNLDYPDSNINKPSKEREDYKMIPAKHKFRGPGIPMSIGTGFPDFIAFKLIWRPEYKSIEGLKIADSVKNIEIIQKEYDNKILYEIIGVEVKSNGYLTKEEKEKCSWYLENNVFSKILIARKGKKRGEIEYVDFGKKQKV